MENAKIIDLGLKDFDNGFGTQTFEAYVTLMYENGEKKSVKFSDYLKEIVAQAKAPT